MAGRIDPTGARNPAEFVVLLRRAAAQAHNSNSDRLAALLDGYEMPPEELVLDILRAAGMDIAQENRWMRIYDELSQWDGLAPLSSQELDDRDLLRARHRRPVAWLTQPRVLIGAGVLVVVLVGWWLFSGGDGSLAALRGGQPSGTPSAQASATDTATDTATPGAMPTAGSSPTTQKSATPPKSPALSGTVTLANGQTFDLDGGGADLRWLSGVLHSADNGKRLQLMPSGTTPTAQTCGALVPGQLDRSVSGLTAGRSLCVRTTQNHWARVSVTAAGSSLTFTYVVFT